VARSESYNNNQTTRRERRRGENEKQQREMRGKKGERQRKRKKKKKHCESNDRLVYLRGMRHGPKTAGDTNPRCSLKAFPTP
jgi:hypothetical protein